MNKERAFGYHAWKDLVQGFPPIANISALAIENMLEQSFMAFRAAHPNYGREAVDKSNGIPPSLDAVRAYFKELGSSCDPEDFMDHYTSVGWVVGRSKAPMKDWPSSCRLWNRRSGKLGDQPKQRVSASLYAIQAQLKKVEDEMADILYPGGAAFKTTPEGKKLERYMGLQQQRAGLKDMLAGFATGGFDENA